MALAQPALLTPFTPEVESGGWMVETEWSPSDGQPHYILDPEHHPVPEAPNEDAITTANANLIAASPRLYRAVAALLDGIEHGEPSLNDAWHYARSVMDDLVETFAAG